MPRIIIGVAGLTLQGLEQPVGAVIELTEGSYQALIKEGKGTPADGTEVQAEPTETEEELALAAAAEVDRQKKALDDQYNLAEGGAKPGLKEAAAAAGVDYAFDVTKGALIDAIVEQGKAAELVK